MSNYQLYEDPRDPGFFIGSDGSGGLYQFPKRFRGEGYIPPWGMRRKISTSRGSLRPLEISQARGTGWPGATTNPQVSGKALEELVDVLANPSWIAAMAQWRMAREAMNALPMNATTAERNAAKKLIERWDRELVRLERNLTGGRNGAP